MIEIQTLQPRILAAVRRVAKPAQIATTWKPALDLVWEFLRRNPGLRDDGHNVFLYHHTAEAMPIDFGVEVTRAFPDEGEVRCVHAPGGEAAVIVHRGDYGGIPRAHAALHAWFAANGRKIGAFSIEVYGDWNADPSKLETTIQYAL